MRPEVGRAVVFLPLGALDDETRERLWRTLREEYGVFGTVIASPDFEDWMVFHRDGRLFHDPFPKKPRTLADPEAGG